MGRPRFHRRRDQTFGQPLPARLERECPLLRRKRPPGKTVAPGANRYTSVCSAISRASHARDAMVVNAQPLGADGLCTVARQVAAGGVDLDLSPV